jgi:hypothetical protein
MTRHRARKRPEDRVTESLQIQVTPSERLTLEQLAGSQAMSQYLRRLVFAELFVSDDSPESD